VALSFEVELKLPDSFDLYLPVKEKKPGGSTYSPVKDFIYSKEGFSFFSKHFAVEILVIAR